jgi:hypothetical protein
MLVKNHRTYIYKSANAFKLQKQLRGFAKVLSKYAVPKNGGLADADRVLISSTAGSA